jgi:hypothetical protein
MIEKPFYNNGRFMKRKKENGCGGKLRKNGLRKMEIFG